MTTATRPGHAGGRPAIPADAFEHGDPRRYWRGCRCQPCRRGVTAHIQKHKYFRSTGRGAMRDPERAARHADQLRAAGMTEPDIGAAARITQKQLRRITRREGRIHATTEQRVLAVPVPDAPAPPTSRAHVPAHGTLRRLHALIAAGWTQVEISRRLDWDNSYLGHLVHGRGGPHVAWFSAAEVRDLYRQLAHLRPEDHGVTPGRARRTRITAAERGWPDPTWWEDWGGIDDPNAPETEQTRRLKRDELAALRREEIQHLASFGIGYEEIARRLGMAPGHVRDIIRELREAA